jgi:hypothetical protein
MLGGGDEYTYKGTLPSSPTNTKTHVLILLIMDLIIEANEHPKIGHGIRFTLDRLVKLLYKI